MRYSEERSRSSAAQTVSSALRAGSCSSAVRARRRRSSCSSVSIHRTTSAIVRPLTPPRAAVGEEASARRATRSRRPAACGWRTGRPWRAGRPSASLLASRRTLRAASSSREDSPVVSVGSKTSMSPSSARRASVSRSRSFLTEVARIGPAHSSSAGTARPVVLPVCVGATTMTDWRASAATSRRRWRPSVTRPSRRAADNKSAQVARLAQRADAVARPASIAGARSRTNAAANSPTTSSERDA